MGNLFPSNNDKDKDKDDEDKDDEDTDYEGYTETEKKLAIENKKLFEEIQNIKEEKIKVEKDLNVEQMKEKLKKIESIDQLTIQKKCRVYYDLFIRIYDKLIVTKKRLDLYKRYLNRVNSVIQLSVINLSIASSFIQALDSRSYNKLFNPNSDNINEEFNETITDKFDQYTREFEHSSELSIVTLSISTYSALIIAAERHFGLQQRETNVERLKDLYTEPISRIKTILELLRPWMYVSYYTKFKEVEGQFVKDKNVDDNDDDDDNDNITIRSYRKKRRRRLIFNRGYVSSDDSDLDDIKPNRTQKIKIFDDEKKTDWIAMMDKLDKEHTHIVDLKKELDNSLEKMISVTTLKKYQVAVPRKRRFSDTHFLRRQKEEEEYYHIHRSFIERCCDKIKYLCKFGRHKNFFGYDEEDLNNFEYDDSIRKINRYI